MTATGPYRALDHRFAVQAADDVADVVRRVMAPLRSDEPAGERPERIVIEPDPEGWRLAAERGPRSVIASPGRLVAALLEHVNQAAASSLTDRLPLHAAAVEAPTGGVVAVAGSSGAGKTTLAAAAVLAGWGYVADEVAAVEPATRSVRAYHRPLGLRRGGAAAIGIDYPDDPWWSEVRPWSPPAAAHRPGGELIGVVSVRRDPGDVVVEPLLPAPALAELVEHVVVPDDAHLVSAFRSLERLVRSVPVVRLRYDEPAAAVATLAELATGWS